MTFSFGAKKKIAFSWTFSNSIKIRDTEVWSMLNQKAKSFCQKLWWSCINTRSKFWWVFIPYYLLQNIGYNAFKCFEICQCTFVVRNHWRKLSLWTVVLRVSIVHFSFKISDYFLALVKQHSSFSHWVNVQYRNQYGYSNHCCGVWL